jgi:CheY-like chemotaxis protein
VFVQCRIPNRSGARARAVAAPARRPERSQPTVLVVDDDEGIRATIAESLRLDGYWVLTARHGAEALEVLAAEGQPCVILLDMRMPVMDGWAFAAVHRARGPGAPIVAVTAAQDAASWAAEIGAADVLPKPFELDALTAVVERACGPPSRQSWRD